MNNYNNFGFFYMIIFHSVSRNFVLNMIRHNNILIKCKLRGSLLDMPVTNRYRYELETNELAGYLMPVR